MALTGKGKLGVTILVAILIGGGAFYANKHKALPVVTPPVAIEQVSPKNVSVPTAPVVADVPEESVKVVPTPVVKKHVVHKKAVVKYVKREYYAQPIHKSTSDADDAMRALAGKSSL